MLRRLITATCLCLLVLASGPAAQATQEDPCQGLPESRLTKGAQARVIAENDRKTPGALLKPQSARLGPVLRYLPLGTVVTLTGDPVCSEGQRWWPVELANLEGWMTETSGLDYILEPFSGEAPTPLATTTAELLKCIRPELGQVEATPTPLVPDGQPVLRIVFAGVDGSLQYTDNAGPARIIAQFDPPPLSVDLSPDGSAVVVVTHNGLYWVDLLLSRVIFLADSTTFALLEEMWPNHALWLPNGKNLAVEIEDSRDDLTSFAVWNMATDGLSDPFRVDTGNVTRNSIRRTPQRDVVILLTGNDIELYPQDLYDEPDPLLEYVPRLEGDDPRGFLPPAVSWAADGEGFYTFIPVSDMAPPDDPVGGRLWYVPLEGKAEDKGRLSNVQLSDYVIPSPDGKLVLLGGGSAWRIQSVENGEVLQQLPPTQYLFDWTPDSQGVVFTTRDGKASFLGIEGETTSPYVPAADNLYDIRWLPDGTTLYVVRGQDEKLSFSVKRPDEEPVFIGIIATVNAFSAAIFPTPPGFARPPQPCQVD